MVYGNFFRKPFSVFYKAIFRSKEKNFRWLSILPRSKHPAWLKTFSVKRFTSIQMEPNRKIKKENKELNSYFTDVDKTT